MGVVCDIKAMCPEPVTTKPLLRMSGLCVFASHRPSYEKTRSVGKPGPQGWDETMSGSLGKQVVSQERGV